MTNPELKELKDLLEKISASPWMATCNIDDFPEKQKWLVQCGEIGDVHTLAQIDWECLDRQECNAKFIALSRIAVPKLIDEIERLKETIRQLKQGLPISGE